MGKIAKWVLIGLALLLSVAVLAELLVPAPKTPPLPFDASAYVSTTRLKFFTLPANPSLKQRIMIPIFSWLEDRQFQHPRPENTTFAAAPVAACSIMGFLNQCMTATGNRYLMSQSVSAGVVQFGHTNALNGAECTAALEAALQSPATQTLDPRTHKMIPGGLVLVRFPEQRTILVLTQPEAAEFRRTNQAGIMVETPKPAPPFTTTN